MNKTIIVIVLAALFVGSYGTGIREILDYLLGGAYYGYGGGYGGYPNGPGYYPGGAGYNQYGRPPGPPGAHPGCPLCDSSVYSYCSHKQAHDSCCCDGSGYLPFSCRKSDCTSLYANSCQEYNLISSCCCVDLYRNSLLDTPAAIVV